MSQEETSSEAALPNVPQCVVDAMNNVRVESGSTRGIKEWFSRELQLTPITSPTTTVLQIPTLVFADSFKPMKQKAVLAQMKNVSSTVEQLTFYTQNVWFDKFNQAERYGEIVSVIETGQPDFVCLQEVIQPLLKLLKDSRVIQEQYYISGNLINGYGLTILSKWPCVFTEVRYDKMTFQSRSLLCCQAMVNGGEVVVSTTHLESCKPNTQYRIQQLDVVMTTLKPHSQALVMGDFNYVPEWQEEDHLDKEFKDYYPVGLTPCNSYAGENVLRKDGVIRSLSDHLGIIAVVKCVKTQE